MLALRKSGVSFVVACIALLAATACGNSGSDVTGNGGTTSPSNVVAVGGNGQTGLIGTALATPLSVKVTTSSGTAVQGATVAFAVTSGAASVSPASSTTDATGVAQTTVTLGSAVGNVTVTASVGGTSLTTTFTLTAGTQTQTTACAAGSPQSVAVGGVVALATGTGVCLSGGTAGSEFGLVVFHANPDSSQIASLTVRSSGGVTPISSANVIPSRDAIPFASTQVAHRNSNPMQAQFDARLRARASRLLASRSLTATASTPSRTVVVPANPAVGSLFTMNANGSDDVGGSDQNACRVPNNVTARVAAVGTTNIILADTANPSPTFSDAEYARFATEFDTLINPLDVQNFGTGSDIDHNGKVLILFTKEVNKLTPRGSNGVIGGFFFERDLFPTVDNNQIGLAACPTSNFAEMFYVLAPDSNKVFGDQRKGSDVLTQTPGTLAHEYQHLINAGRRMYVNTFQGFFEDTWLNEGLSHIAEELMFYRKSGKAPRQNIGINTFAGNQSLVDIFTDEQGQNTQRYQIFLGKPDATSVYAGNDELETRGATWDLLRYLADQRGTSGDADTWQQLVNTESHGQANLARVFGADYMTQIRNWATSVFADDVTGVTGVTDARYLQPSWNYRSIFPALCVNATCSVTLDKYPLKVVPLSDQAPASFSVFAGGAEYVRFFVPAGGTASIDWTSGGLPVSALVQFTVVRSR